ncbi:MAG: hypothetical protein K9G36_02920 [Crocinitomicaceae bacterium]|nr:hypothetical protein [Crocinitomicaceae bacterium]
MKIFNPSNPKTQKNNNGIPAGRRRGILRFSNRTEFRCFGGIRRITDKNRNSEGAEKGSERIKNGNRTITPNP